VVWIGLEVALERLDIELENAEHDASSLLTSGQISRSKGFLTEFQQWLRTFLQPFVLQ
jgi:hypothetical protein